MVFLFLLTIASFTSAQRLGFQEKECMLVINPDYHFDNYSYGYHGSGYVLYHYLTGILSHQSAQPDESYWGYLLRMIPPCGYFVDYRAGSEYTLYKIADNTCTLLGSEAGDFGGLFIVNDHLAYYVIDFRFYGWPRHVNVMHCSDLYPVRSIIYDIEPDSNITVHDTIPGFALCDELTELHYKLTRGGDTLTYTIVLHSDPALPVDPAITREAGPVVYPNPVQDYLYLDLPWGAETVSIQVLNMNTRLVKQYPPAYQQKVTLPVADLPPGFYMLRAISAGWVKNIKFIKE